MALHLVSNAHNRRKHNVFTFCLSSQESPFPEILIAGHVVFYFYGQKVGQYDFYQRCEIG